MSTLTKLETRWLREGAADEHEFERFLARREAGEPVHRILGWREFWGLNFHLSPDTLEPRPDSETVIEVLVSSRKPPNAAQQHEMGGYPGSQDNKNTKIPWDTGSRSLRELGRDDIKILDLGTGTGCLLLSALHEFPNATGMGIDAAAGAVITAQKNACENQLQNRAEFRQLDWYDIAALRALGQFDVILSNPPYIPHADIKSLQPEVREHDPLAALDGGADGLDAYRHIAAQLHYLLDPGGMALFEIGHDQGAALQEILRKNNLLPSPPYQDLGGNDRVITAIIQ